MSGTPKLTWQDRETERIKPSWPEESSAGKSEARDNLKRIAKAEARLADTQFHLHPWKDGLWVSVTGKVYRGNGGKPQEEYFWEQKGPWLLLADDELDRITDPFTESMKEITAERDALVVGIKKLAELAGVEIAE